MKQTIYIDMDGVVADFNIAAMQFLNKTQEDSQKAAQAGRWPKEDWKKLVEIPHFYRNLPKTPYADKIITLARRFRDQLNWDLYMLTAIPKDNDVPDCFQDKILWMQEYYPDIRVRFGPYSFDKAKHCNPGDILVDDRTDNCTQWRAAGGRTVQVKNEDFISALEDLKYLFNLENI